MKAVVTPELFAKYEEFTFIASLNADPSVKWCPKPGCGNAIVGLPCLSFLFIPLQIGDPANPRCQCTNPSCRYEFCFLCNEPVCIRILYSYIHICCSIMPIQLASNIKSGKLTMG